MLFNGAEASPSVVESIISFVTQDDEGLLPSLTVRETLRFAAALRLPSWMTKSEKNKRADEVLLKIGLKVWSKSPPRKELLEFSDNARIVRTISSAANF
jgi:ABC-type multidrug transport system ATPase subunit